MNTVVQLIAIVWAFLKACLCPAMVILSLAGSSSLADDGLVYPETAGVQVVFEIEADTTTIRLINLTENPVQHFFFSHHSVSRPALVNCIIDGQTADSIPTEEELGTVVPSAFTVRWLVGDFEQNVELIYHSPFDSGNYFNWSGSHPFSIFGTMLRSGSNGGTTCYEGRVGDANGLGGDEPTIGDIRVMIDALFIGGDRGVIACLAEADVNQSGGTDPQPSDITIHDISTLIDNLFITGPLLELAECL